MKTIGIIYSPGYGAGFSTWNGQYNGIELDQELVSMIVSEKPKSDWHSYCEAKYPNSYLGGLDSCKVVFVDEGTAYRIDEYDGYESIEFNHDNYWKIAKQRQPEITE